MWSNPEETADLVTFTKEILWWKTSFFVQWDLTNFLFYKRVQEVLTKIDFWIFSNQCFHCNFQLDYHSYGSFPGCCFTGTCYRYSHFVVLNKGSHLKSQNEAVTLRLQEDGNLVLSCLNSPIWSSGTHGNADIKSLVFQENGNLALIKDDTNVS